MNQQLWYCARCAQFSETWEPCRCCGRLPGSLREITRLLQSELYLPASGLRELLRRVSAQAP